MEKPEEKPKTSSFKVFTDYIADGLEKAAQYTKDKAKQFNDPEYQAKLKQQSEDLWNKTKQKMKLKDEDKAKFMALYEKAKDNVKTLDSKSRH